jgi:hypothetical protein
MSFIFLASIFAAAAASTLWAVLAGESRGLTGIALDYLMILVPMSILVFQLAASGRSSSLMIFGVICVLGALFGLGLGLWSRRMPVHDTRPVPRLVRWSFGFFVIALIIAGGALVLKTPNILPWQVTTVSAVIYGWMFLGAAAYFGYGLLRPGWYNAAGQLVGFLAYDVVLIWPFLTQFPTISDQARPSLIIYTLVVSLSALMAIFYLFINPTTRLWRARPA